MLMTTMVERGALEFPTVLEDTELGQLVAALYQSARHLHQRVEQLEELRAQDKSYVDDLESYVHVLKSELDALKNIS